MYVKMCGMMQEEDIAFCADLGVNAIGVVVEFPQPNTWNLDRLVGRRLVANAPAELQTVMVCSGSVKFVFDLATHVNPNAIQLHGSETVADTAELVQRLAPIGIQVYKAISIDPVTRQAAGEITDPVDAAFMLATTGITGLVIDSRSSHRPGGTGIPVDVQILQRIENTVSCPVVVAGGLTPENVRHVIQTVHPYGVDVLSGVEKSPGVKDHERMRKFSLAACSQAFYDLP